MELKTKCQVSLHYVQEHKRKTLKKNAFSLHNNQFGHALSQELLPMGHEIFNFGVPSS